LEHSGHAPDKRVELGMKTEEELGITAELMGC